MSNNQYPFGGAKAPQPEDIKRAYDKNKFAINVLIAFVLVVAFGWVGAYTIEPEEVGVVTTFGKANKETAESGFHWRMPLAQTVYKVPAKRQLKEVFGFTTVSSGVKSEFARSEMTRRQSMMLTGDLNVAVVEWIVHFQIDDPYKYLFKVRNPEGTLRALSEATMREVVGDYSVTEVLTSGREEILDAAKDKLAKLCDEYDTGLSIQRIELKDSAPPDPVKPSFNSVNQAEQERDSMRNQALAEYNKVIPAARGEAKKTIEEAQGYEDRRINNAKGEVALFLALQLEYKASPRVTRSRLYLESLASILPKAGKKMIVDEKLKGMIPMLFPMGQGGGLK